MSVVVLWIIFIFEPFLELTVSANAIGCDSFSESGQSFAKLLICLQNLS